MLMYHRTDRRIEAHIFICVMAVQLHRFMPGRCVFSLESLRNYSRPKPFQSTCAPSGNCCSVLSSEKGIFLATQ
jgi:hypothetical protein